MRHRSRYPFAVALAALVTLSLPAHSEAGRDRDDDRGRSEWREHGKARRGDSGRGRERGEVRAERRDRGYERRHERDGYRRHREHGGYERHHAGRDRGERKDWRARGDHDFERDRRGSRRDRDWQRGAPRHRERWHAEGRRYRGEFRDRDRDHRWRGDHGWRDHRPRYRSHQRPRYTYAYSPWHSWHAGPCIGHRPYVYTSGFHRPRYYGSGFSIGFTIGNFAPRGYRYYDPYCGIGYDDLWEYYAHCDDHEHPYTILVLEVRSGHPVAACAYDGDAWVVADCD